MWVHCCLWLVLPVAAISQAARRWRSCLGLRKNCSGSFSDWRRLSPAAHKIKPFGAREAFQTLKAVLLRPGSPEKSPAALTIKPFGAREAFQTLQTVLPILKPGSPETTALSSALDLKDQGHAQVRPALPNQHAAESLRSDLRWGPVFGTEGLSSMHRPHSHPRSLPNPPNFAPQPLKQTLSSVLDLRHVSRRRPAKSKENRMLEE